MHVGNNIRAVRELLGIKQESLAQLLNISQQTISKIEQTETIRDQTIERIAKALGVPPSTITHFSERKIMEVLSKEQLDVQGSADVTPYYHRLMEKIIELYERLLQAERQHG